MVLEKTHQEYATYFIRSYPTFELNSEIVPALDKLITELSDLDPDSMHFRYAVNKKFADMLLPRSLSMENLKSTMEKIYNGFAYIEAGIDMEWDARDFDAEFRAEMENYYV